MANNPDFERLRTPHPEQARIDAEAAELLRRTARRPGGKGVQNPTIGAVDARRWPQAVGTPIVNSRA